MPSATVTSKGQITIPASVRASLHLAAGDRVEFIELPDGNYEFVPATRPVRSLKGFFGQPKRVVTLEEMDAAIARSASQSAGTP
ncbi:AbrB/MazE/SpoVT family DNA-binding domain-containing protein [Ruania alkalisoli]|uniref:AbrB/MazE/SpoVT family DNA-binding domain-containing protein n=1 Tax=Ruania alkalisoli TaxID=2779775 RepID=A0A7M1SPE8_9MICO|nr:AbrB/MazE/SpoVT family DNA-binding domain-containing protein [Ruania alkalisoli]QOR69430.1 AbrB/MazE/SpoVT family DNA-binding domain-containing protein [Ruania alkalisoli]